MIATAQQGGEQTPLGGCAPCSQIYHCRRRPPMKTYAPCSPMVGCSVHSYGDSCPVHCWTTRPQTMLAGSAPPSSGWACPPSVLMTSRGFVPSRSSSMPWCHASIFFPASLTLPTIHPSSICSYRGKCQLSLPVFLL